MQTKAAAASKELPIRRYSGKRDNHDKRGEDTEKTRIPRSRYHAGPGMWISCVYRTGVVVHRCTGSVYGVYRLRFYAPGAKRGMRHGCYEPCRSSGLPGEYRATGTPGPVAGREMPGVSRLHPGIARDGPFASGAVVHAIENVERDADTQPEDKHEVGKDN